MKVLSTSPVVLTKMEQLRVPAGRVFGPYLLGENTSVLALPSSGVSLACTPKSHELPKGQSEASIVYVPASTCTETDKSAHESTDFVVEPLNRYVPGVGSVTTTPGSEPNVLGRPVTRGYRFASSYPPP